MMDNSTAQGDVVRRLRLVSAGVVRFRPPPFRMSAMTEMAACFPFLSLAPGGFWAPGCSGTVAQLVRGEGAQQMLADVGYALGRRFDSCRSQRFLVQPRIG